MFCRGVRKELIGYIKDLLPLLLKKKVESHLDRCPKCRQEYEEIKETLKTYHSLKDVEPSSGFDTALELRLKESKSRLIRGIQRREAIRYYSRLMWRGFGLAVAALVIVLIGVSAYIGNMKPKPQDTFLLVQPELIPDSQAGLRVFVRDHFSLLPLANADVQIELVSRDGRNKRLAGKYRTNKQGTVDAEMKIPDLPDGNYILRIKTESKHGYDLIENEVTIKRSFTVLLTTDKSLYQPGQVVHIRVLSLKKPDLKPMKGNKATIEVEDSNGNKVFKETKVNSQFGIVHADFQLADEITLGEYRVRAIVGDTETEKTIIIKKYVLPKFKIDISTDKEFCLPGGTINGSINVEYFFGKSVAGAKVIVSASTFLEKFNQFAKVKGTTNEDGVFKFSIEIPDYLTGQELNKGNAFVMLDASVLDKDFHEEKTTKSLIVAKDPINIEVLPESGTLAMGIENLVYIITGYPNGEIAQTDLTIGSERAKTNRLGIARVYLTPKKEKVNLRIRAEDRKGQKVSVDKELTTGKPEENFILRTDKATYFGGETIQISIISAQKEDTVFIDLVHAGQTVLTKTLVVKNGKGVLALDLPPDIFGTLKVHAYKILKDGNIARDTKVIYVSQPNDLKITASLDKDIYKPGEKVKINYSVYDNEGKPTIAALGISIVDESLFALVETHPGLEKVFFTLEKEILKPMSEICTHGAAPEELIEKETSPEVNDLRLALFSVIEDKPGIGSIDETVKKLEGEGYLPKRIGNRMVENVRRAMEDPAFTSQVRRNEKYTDVLRMFENGEYLPVKSGTFEKKEKKIKEFQYEYFGKLRLVICWVVGIILPIVFFWFLIQALRYDGFIQVLACIAIIAILAAMLLPAFATARESARRSIPISCLHQLAIAKAQWDMEHEGKIVPVKELARRELPRIRRYFPETLYWNPELITDEKGHAQLEIELADSITTWRMTTTGVSSEGSLGGITKGIRVFSAER